MLNNLKILLIWKLENLYTYKYLTFLNTKKIKICPLKLDLLINHLNGLSPGPSVLSLFSFVF